MFCRPLQLSWRIFSGDGIVALVVNEWQSVLVENEVFVVKAEFLGGTRGLSGGGGSRAVVVCRAIRIAEVVTIVFR